MKSNANIEGKLSEIVINNVKYFREQAGLNEKELSKRIGKRDDFIKRLENHKLKREPTVVLVDNLAKALNIDLQELFVERK